MANDVKDLEEFSRELQKQIMEQIRRQYSLTVIDHWQNPRNFRKMENPDGYAKVKGPCGDTMEMSIKTREDIIIDCTFQTDGCGTSIACGSMTSELAKEKSLKQALAGIHSNEVLKKLGGLPEADAHCALLAAETLRRSINDYLDKKK
jgi:nitrogen fixation NifU-like protein